MIPNYGDKYDAEALFSPEDALRAYAGGVPEVPSAVILGFQASLTDLVASRAEASTPLGREELYRLPTGVGYVQSSVGAPVAAGTVENVIAGGAEVVCILGGAASLSADVAPDDAVLPTRAIRDEGVSYHYLPPDGTAEPSDPLVDALDARLREAGVTTHRGPTWTTSAFYRETVPEVRQYAAEGVLTCEMEAAGVFAVAEYRGIEAAAVHEVGDYLLDEWDPGTEHGEAFDRLLDPVAGALAAYVR
ncbi:MAG: nucleoside phosphorylase [Haloarculaceae archaeon]